MKLLILYHNSDFPSVTPKITCVTCVTFVICVTSPETIKNVTNQFLFLLKGNCVSNIQALVGVNISYLCVTPTLTNFKVDIQRGYVYKNINWLKAKIHAALGFGSYLESFDKISFKIMNKSDYQSKVRIFLLDLWPELSAITDIKKVNLEL